MATTNKFEAPHSANRKAKEATVEDLRSMIEGQSFMVVVESQGLTVAEVTGLRAKIRAVGEAGLRVAKNTLVRLALKGTPFENLTEFFKGPTALAYGKDPVGIAKALADFAKGNEHVKLIAANLNGAVLDSKATHRLASLPPLNELRAKIVGMLQTPATRMAVVLAAPASQLARVMSAKAKKEG